MATDYASLREHYPEIISKEQLCKICHISKRKATWLLEHGIILCEDSGKKTRRFKVKLTDAVSYLRATEESSEKAVAPKGIFCSIYRPSNEVECILRMSDDELPGYLSAKLEQAPDALTAADVAKLTGCSGAMVQGWIFRGELKSVRCPTETVVSKVWLIEFLVRYARRNPKGLPSLIAAE